MKEKPKWYSGLEYFEPSFELAVSMDLIPGVSFEHKFGLDEAVTAAFTAVWPLSIAYVYLSVETTLNVSSGDVDDTAAGTGAQQIMIEGLDGDYNQIETHVEMNGQTAVPVSKKFLRIHRMKVTRGAPNEGIIYVGTGGPVTGVPTISYGVIPLGYGQTQQPIYTVPKGFSGYLYDIDTKSAVQQKVIARLMVRELGGVFQAKDTATFFDDDAPSEWHFPLKISSMSDIEYQAFATGAGGQLASSFTVLLIRE